MAVGQELVQENIKDAPLLWDFHGTKYLSAAHGAVGIIYILLQMRKETRNKHKDLMDKCIKWLMSIRYDSGNYPADYAAVGNPRADYLVQWCHGSPSYVSLFVKYYDVFGSGTSDDDEDAKYNDDIAQNDDHDKVDDIGNECIKAIDDGCEHIWKYGLLTKSRSICHGISGNAYTFLLVYSIMKKYGADDIDAEKWLYYAFQFANFMTNEHTTLFREPDNEDSLFEGVSGECCFLMDLLFHNNNPKFPCYDF